MNALMEKFGSTGRFNILAQPSNEFGKQENGDGDEILNSLKYVRPGKGFEPKFPLLEKGNVNGEKATPLYQWLRASIPYTEDRTPQMDNDEPYGILKPANAIPTAVRSPTDVLWNFAKFLVDAKGVPRHRFSPKFPVEQLEPFIEALLKEASPSSSSM